MITLSWTERAQNDLAAIHAFIGRIHSARLCGQGARRCVCPDAMSGVIARDVAAI